MSSLQKALVQGKKNSLQNALAKEMIQSGGGKRNVSKKNPPTVTTADESSSEEEDDDDSSSSSSSSDESDTFDETERIKGEDLMKIRRDAIKLINTPSSGPHADARRNRQQSSGKRPTSSGFGQPSPVTISSYQSSTAPSPGMHNPQPNPHARTAEKLTMADMLVNCIAEVCKSSSSEILTKVMSSGYRSVNNYENPPVSGSWGEIDTSRHGYGNSNRAPGRQPSNKSGGAMPSRYQD